MDAYGYIESTVFCAFFWVGGVGGIYESLKCFSMGCPIMKVPCISVCYLISPSVSPFSVLSYMDVL